MEKMCIQQNLYKEEFGKPMTAYRFIATFSPSSPPEFRAKTRGMENFPFDHHELKIVARSREADELKINGVVVSFHHNDKLKRDLSPAENHLAYDVFDFAVGLEVKTFIWV